MQPPGFPPAEPVGAAEHGHAAAPVALLSGIRVKANFIFLQWMLLMVNPVLTINGYPQSFRWGQDHVVPLAPGQYQIKIHFPWVITEGCAVTRDVPVYAGHLTEIGYSTAFFVFSPGTMTQRGFSPWGA